MKRLGILLSGRGSNFEAIAKNIQAGHLAAQIAVVLSNRASAPGLEIARNLGIPAVTVPAQDVDRLLVEELCRREVDLVCLAGYMRIIGADFLRAFSGRILNIHPSLLPAFPGLHAQRQALNHGVKITGCTVHFVNEQMDAGPIVLQAAVPVNDDDTEDSLSARILEQEHRIYTEAIQLILAGSYRIEGRRVNLVPSTWLDL